MQLQHEVSTNGSCSKWSGDLDSLAYVFWGHNIGKSSKLTLPQISDLDDFHMLAQEGKPHAEKEGGR